MIEEERWELKSFGPALEPLQSLLLVSDDLVQFITSYRRDRSQQLHAQKAREQFRHVAVEKSFCCSNCRKRLAAKGRPEEETCIQRLPAEQLELR